MGGTTEETRTEAQILGAESRMVMLGGKEYQLAPKRGRKHTRAIRKKLGHVLHDMTGMGDTIKALVDAKAHEVDSGAISVLVPLLQRFLGPDFDDLLDIVYDYSDDIAADRDRLEDEATDEEFVKALFVIIGFLFGPFAKAMGIAYQKKTDAIPQPDGVESSSNGPNQ